MKKIFAAALIAASLLAAPASAASYVLNLTGNVSSGATATVDSGGFRFNFFTIALANFSPTTFQVGDDVQATITLDQQLTVPTATVRNGVDLILLNTTYPGTTTTTTGTTDLFDMGVPAFAGAGSSSSADQLVNGLVNFGGSSFTFDLAQSNFVVTALGAASLDTDTALFRYITVDELPPAAVPEPAAWAMMVLGFGLIGATARRRPYRRLALA